MMGELRPWISAGLLATSLFFGCSSNSEQTTEKPVACTEEVVPFRELMIVDEEVVTDARSLNASSGPWSFRHAIEEMTPPNVLARDYVMTWLRTWIDQTQFNGELLDRPGERRDVTMMSTVICPWLHRTASNNCDATCTVCARQELDLAYAPFRLLAIVNRMDQRVKKNPAGPAGEGRFVFGLTDGPADDPASQPLAMTAIFEYRLPDSKTPSEWAKTWHGLSHHQNTDEAYRVELQAITDAFSSRNASPERPNGSALAQLRTNDSVLNWIWQLREFAIDSATGAMKLRGTRDTPAEEHNGSAALASWVLKNADAIKRDEYELPTSFLNASVDQFVYRWDLPGVDEITRRAFVAGTCNGCHSDDNNNRDNAFHVNPYKKGREKLSKFIYDPENTLRRDKDDLAIRIELHHNMLCGDPSKPGATPAH